jgi:hypothetical protein
MRRIFCWFILLLRRCIRAAKLPRPPEQPNGAQSYARIVLPEAIRLVALDNQAFDPRLRIREIQVTPGSHILHFAYAGNSPQHAGQQNEPFRFEVQAGHQYIFDART